MKSGHHAKVHTATAGTPAIFRHGRLLKFGDIDISSFSKFSGDLAFDRLPGRRWAVERAIDGVLAVTYVLGCACLAWAGSTLG